MNKVSKKHIKMLFMGTPEFSIPTLNELAKLKKHGYALDIVVTAPDKKVGRKQILTPPPVKVWAEKHKITVFQPKKLRTPENIEKIKKASPDLIVVLAYGQIIPKEILDIPTYGAINIHPSLLPKYRGASPIQNALLSGDSETGTTIILMDEKMDHGPIISQTTIPIGPEETYEMLSQKLMALSATLLIKTIPGFISKELKPIPQLHADAIYTELLTKDSGRIMWGRTARDIERKIRAYNPWPGSFTEWELDPNKIRKLKILKAQAKSYSKTPQKRSYGHVFQTKSGSTCIHTGNGYLVLERVQMESKKEQTIGEFLNGYPNFIDSILI